MVQDVLILSQKTTQKAGGKDFPIDKLTRPMDVSAKSEYSKNIDVSQVTQDNTVQRERHETRRRLAVQTSNPAT